MSEKEAAANDAIRLDDKVDGLINSLNVEATTRDGLENMSEQEKHSPLPFQVKYHLHSDVPLITCDATQTILFEPSANTLPPEVVKANAAFIERACNSHDALVEALEKVKALWAFDAEHSDHEIHLDAELHEEYDELGEAASLAVVTALLKAKVGE